MVVNRNFTNISLKAIGQLISLKDAASRKVSKNAVYNNNKKEVFYLPAIRLFFSLNFKVSTNDGSAECLLISDLAREVHCCSKTVRSSLDKLSKGDHPLISYHIDESTKLLNVKILDYEKMFEKRGNGGLGYIVVDSFMMGELAVVDNINDMRIILRSLIECTEQDGYEATVTVNSFVKGLPSYVRPCNVRSAFEQAKTLFNLYPNKNKSAYHVSIDKMFRAKDRKQEKLAVNRQRIKELIDDFNRSIDMINKSHSLGNHDGALSFDASVSKHVKDFLHVSFDFKAAIAKELKELPKFNFLGNHFDDAALIATQLNFDAVKGALYKYMEQYVLTGLGSKRKDTMAVIQSISESIFTKNKIFMLSEINVESKFDMVPAL